MKMKKGLPPLKDEQIDDDDLESFRNLISGRKLPRDEDLEGANSDDDVNSNAHRKLLLAIEKIDRTQHIKAPSRTEVATRESEFHVVKGKGHVEPGERFTFHKLTNVPKKSSESVAKDLKKLSRSKKRLAKPLEKPVAERIARGIAYEKAKFNLDRWEAVVQKNRFEDCLIFPQKDSTEVAIEGNSKDRTPSYRIKSDLMLELEALEAKRPSKPDDEVKLAQDPGEKVSRKDLVAQQKELARLRRKESYEIEKARRQNKIKSKKYHKVLKKDRIRKQLVEFEKLQKSDPEEALRRLELIERNRVAERSHLRHRNTGSWAKSLQVRAKFDKDARREISEQLAIGRELKEQKQKSESEESEQEDQEAPDVDYDPFNPWQRTKNDTPEDTSGGYRKYWEERNRNDEKMKEFQAMEVTKGQSWTVEDIEEGHCQLSTICLPPDSPRTSLKRKKTSKSKKKSIDEVFDSAEQTMTLKVARKLANFQKETTKSDKNFRKPFKNDKHLSLELKKTAQRPDIDEALEESTGKGENTPKNFPDLKKILSSEDTEVPNIAPDAFATVEPKTLRTALPDAALEDDGEEVANGKLSLTEAFEDDDIFTDFSREKADQVAADQPQDIDLTLPGWGSWTGQGTKRVKRMVLKFPKDLKRRDSTRDSVILNEILSEKAKQHLVRDLPFPFTSVKDFEASIRAPVGRTFVPETAHRVLTKPSLITKMGAVIEPMDEKMLLDGEKPQRVRERTKTGRRIQEIVQEGTKK